MEQPALGIQGLIHALRRTQIRESMASSIYQQTPPVEWKGLNFHYGQCYQVNVPPTLPSPPLGGHAPNIHFPKQNFQVTESQGSKLQTGRAGQAIWCLNHYLHCTSNLGLLPDQILKRLPRLISARLVLFGAKSSLSLAWPFDQKSGRGGGGETAVCREPSGTRHMARNLGLSDALRGQELCRGPARRETDSPAASQISGSLWDSILPWMMCAGPSPSLSHCGTRTSSIASYSKPLPSLPHSPGTFYHLLKLTTLLLFCWGWANRGCRSCGEPEEGACDSGQWKCHYKRVTESNYNSAAVAQKTLGQPSLQENPRANFSNS